LNSSIPATRTSISGVISSDAVWIIRQFYTRLHPFIKPQRHPITPIVRLYTGRPVPRSPGVAQPQHS
jgi:hypothetical protein